MELFFGPLVGLLVTVAAGLFTVWVARKKGLPDINKEIESRLAQLNQTLDDQLAAAYREIKTLSEKFEACSKDLHEVMRQRDDLRRRVIEAEADIVKLYRGQSGASRRRSIKESDEPG